MSGLRPIADPFVAAAPTGVHGYATPAERHAKAIRLQALRARLAAVERQAEAGTVSVVRGGKVLLRKRGNLTEVGMTEARWRLQWESARLFLTADGEKDTAWGNQTIRWNPDEGWLEVRLPTPLARLANRPHGRYRLSAPVEFRYRGDEVAAQTASGAVRYDIICDPARGRWYIDASWKAAPAPAPSLDGLRQHPVLAVDLNHGHLAAWAVTPDGNPAGPPVTIPLTGLPATGRGYPDREVPGPAGSDGLQRRAGGDRRRSRLHVLLGPRALARSPAGPVLPGPCQRPPRGRSGDRQACARPPGAAKGRCDRRRPADRLSDSYPQSICGQANDQERQAPRGPAAATPVAEDRDGQPDPPAQPGDPGPFGAAGDTGLCPASSVGTV